MVLAGCLLTGGGVCAGPCGAYRQPYEDVVGQNPTVPALNDVVIKKGRRPLIRDEWRRHQVRLLPMEPAFTIGLLSLTCVLRCLILQFSMVCVNYFFSVGGLQYGSVGGLYMLCGGSLYMLSG